MIGIELYMTMEGTCQHSSVSVISLVIWWSDMLTCWGTTYGTTTQKHCMN